MSSNPQAPRWDETCESIEVFEFNRRIETNRAAIEESLIALRADLAVAKIRVDEKMSEVEASKTALNSRNEEYAILSTKFNDQATALEQVKSDGIAATGEVSNLKAQIESLTSRHQDQVKSDANAAAAEVSNLKAQMESLKSQHQAQLSASQATLKRKEEASAELLTFQHAVLRWHGIEDSESDVSVVEDFLDIARRAIQPEPAPVLPSLDGLRLIPADQHPISSNRSIHGQAIRFWYTCRVDAGVDPLAANGMLNSPLMDPAEWFMVPFLYKGLGILVQRLSQYDMTMILSLSEWYIIMLLRGLLSMMVLSRVSSETVPSDVNVRSMFDIIDLRIAAWLSTHTSALVTALLSTVRKCMGAVPEPTACHDMILDFVKAIGKYLDSSNSDLPFGICLAANLPEKSFLLFIDTDSSVKKIFCLTKDDIALRDGKAFNYSLTLSPISNELPEHVRTLHLGKLLAVRVWLASNFF